VKALAWLLLVLPALVIVLVGLAIDPFWVLVAIAIGLVLGNLLAVAVNRHG
jgi:hypothetical protein